MPVVKKGNDGLILVGLLSAAAIYAFSKKVFGIDCSDGNLLVLEDVKYDFRKMSITPFAAIAIAEQQFFSMKGVGTDEVALLSSLAGLNADDLKAILRYFGRRKYPASSEPMNLIQWYNHELSGKTFEEMCKIWKKAKVI